MLAVPPIHAAWLPALAHELINVLAWHWIQAWQVKASGQRDARGQKDPACSTVCSA
jgi:hypothetical protein